MRTEKITGLRRRASFQTGPVSRWEKPSSGRSDHVRCSPIAMVIVFIGVSGSGRSTVGNLFPWDLGCKFYEGDRVKGIEPS